MYSNSGETNKDLECATDPMHPKQDWVMHQYKLRGFGNMSHAGEGYNARLEAVRKISILEFRFGTRIAVLTYQIPSELHS